MLASAGNDGDEPNPPHARLNSAFATQALVGDLSTLLADHPDRDDFLVEWKRRTTRDPRLATTQGHTLVVGSARSDGSPLPSSTSGHDVRMVGEQVEGACVVADSFCNLDFRVTKADGTSAATPAAAGLAAYMWSMDPELPAVDLRARLLASRSADRWIDAYDAVLSLEQDGGPKIRAAIADVGGGANGRGDGRLDERDLLGIVEAMNATLSVPFEQRKPDWSRFDLNGDGFTRKDTFVKLDLDADGKIGMARVDHGGRTSSFDEQLISDLEYLCYIAFTPEYAGNRAVPESMVSSCRTLDDGPPDVLRPYAGTVSYSVTHVGVPIRSCGSAASRTTTTTLSAQVSCPPFDPRTSVGRCTIVSGNAEAALSFSGQVSASAVVSEFSTFSCMQDSDCGGGALLCMGQTDACGVKHDVPGTCGSCEVFRTSRKSYGSSGSVDLAEHAGTQLLLVGTGGSFRGGGLASLSSIEVEVLGTAENTVRRRGECSIGGGSNGGTSTIGELLSVGTGTSFDLGIEIEITDDAITGGGSGTRSSGVAPDQSQTTWSVSLSLQAQ